MRKIQSQQPLDMRRVRLECITLTDIPICLERRSLLKKQLDALDRQLHALREEEFILA